MSDKIVSLQHLMSIKDLEKCEFLVTSGGFDPLHVGHLRCIQHSTDIAIDRNLKLVVIVNGDGFLIRKKGKPFMSHYERMEMVAALEGVDFVVGWDDGSQTVTECLRILHPKIFTKGGDRSSPEAIPEWQVCQDIGCQIFYGIGGTEKLQSSSNLIAQSKGTATPTSANRPPVDRITKPWGYEEIFVRTDRYVGKLIHVDDQKRLSRQYHVVKDETIYVKSGQMVLEINAPGDTSYQQILLKEGESYHIRPGIVHRFCALTGPVDILEVSTPELDDVVRLSDDYGRVQ